MSDILPGNGSDLFKITVANAIRGVANTPADLRQQWISLHTQNPGFSGFFEVSDAGYARQEVTWAAAVEDDGKGKLVGNPLTFNLPAGVTIQYYGVWNVATGDGGSNATGFLYGKELSAAVSLNAAGKITITPTHLYGLL